MKPIREVFTAMIAKDLVREMRSREVFISTVLFSVILLIAIYFAAAAGRLRYQDMGAGALWLCVIFSGTLGMNRTHQSELQNGCYRALILYPVEGGWLYLAKTSANFMLLALMALLLLPLLALFFHVDLGANFPGLAAGLLLGVLAFTAVGTLIVVITANTRMKDVLFPVIQLPLVVPILIAGVNSSAAALRGEATGQWLQFLAALNLVFIPLGFLLYDFLLEE